jgi:hypothetical protein
MATTLDRRAALKATAVVVGVIAWIAGMIAFPDITLFLFCSVGGIVMLGVLWGASYDAFRMKD